MSTHHNLDRFLDAQQTDYAKALAEIKSGQKRSHWMWYIFPQLQGLGISSTARFYGIANIHEAEAYLQHPVLGARLVEISGALLLLNENNPYKILGSPDDMKLKSSMTLFSSVKNADAVFHQVLNKFYGGEHDESTIRLLNQRF